MKQDLSVCGDVLVWAELRNVGGRTDICGRNLKTGAELSIATGPEWQLGPAVYGDFVVWVERKEDWTGSRICGRSISTVTATPLPLIMRMPFGFNCLYGGLFITALIGSSFMMRKWSLRDSFFPGKGRELRRGPYYSVGFLISAAIFAFWGFRLLSNFRDESGLMLLLPCTLSLLGFFWYRENPYVRITEERIILFDALFYPQIIARDEIRDIKFQPWKARIELVLDGRTIRVDLNAVKPEQERDLITLLHVRTQDPTREENSE